MFDMTREEANDWDTFCTKMHQAERTCDTLYATMVNTRQASLRGEYSLAKTQAYFDAYAAYAAALQHYHGLYKEVVLLWAMYVRPITSCARSHPDARRHDP